MSQLDVINANAVVCRKLNAEVEKALKPLSAADRKALITRLEQDVRGVISASSNGLPGA